MLFVVLSSALYWHSQIKVLTNTVLKVGLALRIWLLFHYQENVT